MRDMTPRITNGARRRRRILTFTAILVAAVGAAGCAEDWHTVVSDTDPTSTRDHGGNPGLCTLSVTKPTINPRSGGGYNVDASSSLMCKNPVDSKRLVLTLYAADPGQPWAQVDEQIHATTNPSQPGLLNGVTTTSTYNANKRFKVEAVPTYLYQGHTYKTEIAELEYYYWVSWLFGDSDHSISQTTERRAATSALASASDTQFDNLWNGLSLADRDGLINDTDDPNYAQWASRVTDVSDYHWASWKYGGIDRSINNATEQAAVTSALELPFGEDTNLGDAAYDALWSGIAPDDQEALSDYWYNIAPETPVDDSAYGRSGPRAVGSAPPGLTWSEFADFYAPYVGQHEISDDGFTPISFDWVGRMKRDNHRTCVWSVNEGRCKGDLRFPPGLQRWWGSSYRLDQPGDGSKSAQKSVIEDTIQTKAHPNRHQSNSPAYYYYVSDTEPGGTYWIQYWYFWSYNYYPLSSADDHEGDWEHIDIHFHSDDSPSSVWFYRHGPYEDHFTFAYDNPDLSFRNGHVVGYAAKGDHGFYNSCGYKDTPGGGFVFQDHTCYRNSSAEPWQATAYVGPKAYRQTTQYNLRKYVSGANAWSCWQGKFGKGSGSPNAPLRQSPQRAGAAALCNAPRPPH